MNQYTLNYPESELGLKDKINQLNDKWLDFLKIQLGNEYSDNMDDLFVSDGFILITPFRKRKFYL